MAGFCSLGFVVVVDVGFDLSVLDEALVVEAAFGSLLLFDLAVVFEAVVAADLVVDAEDCVGGGGDGTDVASFSFLPFGSLLLPLLLPLLLLFVVVDKLCTFVVDSLEASLFRLFKEDGFVSLVAAAAAAPPVVVSAAFVAVGLALAARLLLETGGGDDDDEDDEVVDELEAEDE